MKTKHLLGSFLFCILAITLRAEGPALSLEPYATASWTGLEGRAVTGAGATLKFDLTKNFALTLSGETDNTQHSFVDRGVAGVRYTAWFGKRFSTDLGVGLGHDFEGDQFFARVPLGVNWLWVKQDRLDAGLRAAYAIDVSGSARQGTADGRAFVGPFLRWRF